MRIAHLLSTLLVAPIVSCLVSMPALAYPEEPSSMCIFCHRGVADPDFIVTVTEGPCLPDGKRVLNITVPDVYDGAEGWGIWNGIPVKVGYGYGTTGSIAVDPGADYQVQGVSDMAAPYMDGDANWADITPTACAPACTDADADGYSITGGECGVVDCDDGDRYIFPGAPEVAHDGADQDCNGYDLTIDGTASYNAKKMTLTVQATSGLGSSAALSVQGFGPMLWNKRTGAWKLTVSGIAKPATVTISGVEGFVDVVVP